MKELSIEYLNINELTPYENNAKIHTPEQIDEIKNSIKEFGMNDPIGVWREENLIVEGHGRLIACKELGLKEVPVIRLDDLTDEQRRAYTLAHNQLTMSTGFDLGKLKIELDEITLDMSEFGFDDMQLDDSTLYGENEIVEDEIPEVPEEPKSKYGDIYQLGNHRLMCGDSTKREDVEKLMVDGKADMVFTDPPYNCDYGNIKHPKSKVRNIKNDNMSTESFRTFCVDFISNIKKYTIGCVYMCAGQGKDGRVMFTVADNILHNSTTIIWNKDRFTLGRGKYQNKYEPIWFGWVENGNGFTDDRTLSNVWDIKRPTSSDLHPTMKPIELIATALRHNPKSKTVLDLFGGSGSTLIACEQLNRNCYMIELDPKYVDVIIQRWEEFTGLKAVKLKGGGLSGKNDKDDA